jgi:hypothetical protein
MQQRHTSENIGNTISEIAADFGIEDISCITHDNAANMTAALPNINGESLHMPCFGHTLQLVVEEALNNRDPSNAIAAGRNVVNHFRRSTLATDELHKRQKQMNLPELSLIQDVSTRWGPVWKWQSTLLQISCQFMLFCKIPQLRRPATCRQLQISEQYWTSLEILPSILKPLQIATQHMGGEEFATLGHVYPILHGLMNIHIK